MKAPEGQPPDLELIRRTQQGDTTAFDELMIRYNHAVYRLAWSFVRNHADAEDVSQEAFIRAWRAIGRFDPKYRFYTWLHRITVNLCMNHFRRQKRANLVPLPGGEPGSEWQDMPDPNSGVEDGELRRALDKALNELPDDQRAVLLLRAREELSYEEISQALGIPVGTVMSRLSRARGRLRGLLKEQLPASK
ncbi:MAG: sigma-70 family RNA polymerase sigma factor [bacterium]